MSNVLSLELFFALAQNYLPAEGEPTVYPRFPTRGVRTVDYWSFRFEEDLSDAVPVATQKNTTYRSPDAVLVPDAFDLPPPALEPSCGNKEPHCCHRALGVRGAEACWSTTNSEILELDPEDHGDESTFEKCCEFNAAMTHKRGVGVYETELGGHATMLRFHGCLLSCEVLVDGKQVAEFVSGYAPVDVDIGPFRLSKKLITVRADNRFSYEKMPIHQRRYDWYQPGGIIRPVEAHGGNHLLVKQVAIIPVTLDSVDLRVKLSRWETGWKLKLGWEDRCGGSGREDLPLVEKSFRRKTVEVNRACV